MDYWQDGFLGLVGGKMIFDFWWHELREGMQCGRKEGSLLTWVERKPKKEKKFLFFLVVGIKKLIFGFTIQLH